MAIQFGTMKNKPTLGLLLCIVIAFPVLGQLQPVYTFLKDDSLLKRNYYDQTILKKKTIINSLGKENNKDYKTIYERNFAGIEDLWKSNRVITAAPAHDYLQAVVKKIVNNNPSLNGIDARVVFTRDDWPNAYSMGDGTIVFNAGMLVYLDNEAELAFILCHELSHYYLKHSERSVKKYVETINSEEFKKEIKRLSKEEYRVREQLEKFAKIYLFDSRKHSRENEAEADRQAFLFMKNSGYDVNAIRTGLELLDRVDDSLLHEPVAVEQMFNFPAYPFKKKWITKESAIFSQLDENDSPLTKAERDSLKTHPDCSRRISLLADSIRAVNIPGKKFQVDEQKFRQLKQDMFPEILEHSYRDQNLGMNLYYSLVLLEQKKQLPLAVYSVARCLNEIYENQKDHTLGLKVGSESRAAPPDYNLLMRMLSKLRLEEIAAINYHFCKKFEGQMSGYRGFAEEMRKAQALMK